LAPGIDRNFFERDEREGHHAVAVDRAEEEPALVRAEHEIYPIVLSPEKPFPVLADLGNAARDEILLATAPRKEPAANGRCLRFVELSRERQFGRLQRVRKFQSGTESSGYHRRAMRQHQPVVRVRKIEI